MARELEIYLDPFDQESFLPLFLVGLVFQNKMRSFRKRFLIPSGRHEKGELGKWTDVAIQRRTRDLRKRKRERPQLCGLNIGFRNACRGNCFQIAGLPDLIVHAFKK